MRIGESNQPWQTSHQKFLLLDFDDWHFVAPDQQHAKRGEQQRVVQGGGRLPPRSHSVALAAPMGLSGNELPRGGQNPSTHETYRT